MAGGLGCSLAITIYFTGLGERRKLVVGTKVNYLS
jgi:hypothetical protein